MSKKKRFVKAKDAEKNATTVIGFKIQNSQDTIKPSWTNEINSDEQEKNITLSASLKNKPNTVIGFKISNNHPSSTEDKNHESKKTSVFRECLKKHKQQEDKTHKENIFTHSAPSLKITEEEGAYNDDLLCDFNFLNSVTSYDKKLGNNIPRIEKKIIHSEPIKPQISKTKITQSEKTIRASSLPIPIEYNNTDQFSNNNKKHLQNAGYISNTMQEDESEYLPFAGDYEESEN